MDLMEPLLRKPGFVSLSCLLLVAVFDSCPAQDSSTYSRLVDHIEFDETPLPQAIEYLRERSVELDAGGSGLNFLIDPAVDSSLAVSVSLNRISLGNALICLVEQTGLDYRIEPHGCLILAQGKGELAKRVLNPDRSPVVSVDARRARECQLDRVEFDEVPIQDALQYLARRTFEMQPAAGGVNLVLNRQIDPEIPVTMKLSGMPVSEVLNYVARMTGVEIRIEPYAICLDPPGTKAMREAIRKRRRLAQQRAWEEMTPLQYTKRGADYTLGDIPKDPRSPAHPDYVSSHYPDIRERTNALNNVYKWVNGKWTFVRYGSGDPNKPTLDENGRRIVTPTLQGAKLSR